ncbi:MAG: peptide-methionine (S)-S-oxide reductase MsrA [Cyclobacteriaceae bacterium]|nr:peptide-methionine (S)-S-oxide reductase MsrA [Cyclobacteriaceae bacterium]
MKNVSFFLLILFAGVSGAQQKDNSNKSVMNKGLTLATFGSGCFWCTEAVFQRVNGIEKVVSGYMGGSVKNPSYKEVTTGQTGHAEVTQLSYDAGKISFEELLEIFWGTHDPTTLNRQGADVGTQYRSVIFYHTEEQKRLSEAYKKKLDISGAFDKPLVTEIASAEEFYPAEDYHQNYYNLNNNAGYCTYVIQPKLEKFKKVFADKLKQ